MAIEIREAALGSDEKGNGGRGLGVFFLIFILLNAKVWNLSKL